MRTVCFGEIMIRLNPEGYKRLSQADKLEVSFAGAEANVAVSLSNFGGDASFVTKLPKNGMSEAIVKNLMSYGVDISDIVYGGERIGVYYLEKGASQRPSTVIYDRKYSSISTSKLSDFDFDRIFKNADWFHFTGITPALGDNLAEICKVACQKAKEYGLKISCDLNYRKLLWSFEKAGEVMGELMPYVDVLFANEEDAYDVFGISAKDTCVMDGKISKEGYAYVAKTLSEKFDIPQIAITLRGSISASVNEWSGMLYDRGRCYYSQKYTIQIVDRVGGGDSFCGALIYALQEKYDLQEALDFAVAASCLKHTIENDFNQVSVAEVKHLMEGNVSGRIQR
jgi:2-dehydro-3-deoxygluconokinase